MTTTKLQFLNVQRQDEDLKSRSSSQGIPLRGHCYGMSNDYTVDTAYHYEEYK